MSIKLRDITFELDSGKSIKPGDAIHKAIKIIKKPEIKKICDYLDSGKHIVSGGDVHKKLSALVSVLESSKASTMAAYKTVEVAKKATVDAEKAQEKADKKSVDMGVAKSGFDSVLKVNKISK